MSVVAHGLGLIRRSLGLAAKSSENTKPGKLALGGRNERGRTRRVQPKLTRCGQGTKEETGETGENPTNKSDQKHYLPERTFPRFP